MVERQAGEPVSGTVIDPPATQSGEEGSQPPPPAPSTKLTSTHWQQIVAIYELQRLMREGRMVSDVYEVFRDQDGRIHIVITEPAG